MKSEELSTVLKKAVTLSQATTALHTNGFTAQFQAKEDCIVCHDSSLKYQPQDLTILATCRFEGQSNPADSTSVLAIEASDGTKGTMVLSHSAKHSQDAGMIKAMPLSDDVIRC